MNPHTHIYTHRSGCQLLFSFCPSADYKYNKPLGAIDASVSPPFMVNTFPSFVIAPSLSSPSRHLLPLSVHQELPPQVPYNILVKTPTHIHYYTRMSTATTSASTANATAADSGPISSAVVKRLRSELMGLMMANISGISAFPDSDNLLKWRGTITGAAGTVYEGLKYKLLILFPSNYPYKAPTITFETPCWHPNVDEHGNICLDILKVGHLHTPLCDLILAHTHTRARLPLLLSSFCLLIIHMRVRIALDFIRRSGRRSTTSRLSSSRYKVCSASRTPLAR